MNHYILDSNFFIQSMEQLYFIEMFPGYWDWVEYEISRKTFIIIDKVYDELVKYENHESKSNDWLKSKNIKKMVVKTDNLIEQLKKIEETVLNMRFNNGHNGYEPEAVNEFFKVADSTIIAYALEQNAIIVTDEKPENTITRIKIPNVCYELNVNFINNNKLLPYFNPVFYWDKDSYKK